MPEPQMSPTEVYKTLILSKCPPESEREKVYASIIIALSERVEKLEKQIIETLKAVQFLANVIAEGEGAEPDPAVVKAQVQAEGGGSPADATPFPEGLKTSAPPGTPPQVHRPAQAAPAAEGPMVPDTQSGPPMNAQPIPPSPRNGA